MDDFVFIITTTSTDGDTIWPSRTIRIDISDVPPANINYDAGA
jgi:hypothetical protein